MSKKQEFKLLEAAIKYAEENNGGIELVKAFVAGAAAFGIEGETIPVELKTDDPEAVATAVEINGVNYVRVHAGKYDFRIDIHDAPDLMNWDEANKYAEDKGMRLFSVEEGLLMYCFKDEINAKMVELGGEALREDEGQWSGTEYNRGSARYVGFTYGYATYGNKCTGHVVRPVAEHSSFCA